LDARTPPGLLATRWHGVVQRAAELRPATLLDLLTAADALRRPERLDWLLQACEADALSRPGAPAHYVPAGIVREALTQVQRVDAGALARAAQGRGGKGDRAGDAIAKAVRAGRIAALRRWRNARRAGAEPTPDSGRTR